jgi:lipopolysaccharide/colanic/teichoic acid biosynthesis glycosyltransferase
MYKSIGKRFLDLVLGLFLLIITSPIIFLVWLTLLFANQGSPFFYQRRPGLNEKIFLLVKFKTMKDLYDDKGRLLEDEKRFTTIGKFIRSSSLDELPQLWNVLKGDMSLVGPRPLLEEYLVLYSKEQNKRHSVKPGITGWAQINGRNAMTWEKRFQLDIWYVENLSFFMDLKIILKTILKIVNSDGINQEGHSTMPKFKGTIYKE